MMRRTQNKLMTSPLVSSCDSNTQLSSNASTSFNQTKKRRFERSRSNEKSASVSPSKNIIQFTKSINFISSKQASYTPSSKRIKQQKHQNIFEKFIRENISKQKYIKTCSPESHNFKSLKNKIISSKLNSNDSSIFMNLSNQTNQNKQNKQNKCEKNAIINTPSTILDQSYCNMSRNSDRLGELVRKNSLEQSKIKTYAQQRKDPIRIQDFTILSQCFEEGFSESYVALHQKSNMIVTLRMIDKAKIRQQGLQKQVTFSLKVHSFIDHPNSSRVFGIFDDSVYIYVIEQYIHSCNLQKKKIKNQFYHKTMLKENYQSNYSYIQDSISKFQRPWDINRSLQKSIQESKFGLKSLNSLIQKQETIEQKNLRQIISQLIQILGAIHKFGLVHRNLDIFSISYSFGLVKVRNYDWVCFKQDKKQFEFFCGNLCISPPQILLKGMYSDKIDQWQLGLIIYQLAANKYPFGEREKLLKGDLQFCQQFYCKEKIMERIQKIEIQYSLGMDSQLVRLLNKLICPQRQRFSTQQIKRNDYLKSHIQLGTMISKQVWKFWLG